MTITLEDQNELENIGPFIQLFGEDQLFGELLNLNDKNRSQYAIITIQNILNENSNLEPELHALIDSMNWRLHLVAGIALLLNAAIDFSDRLWWAFDGGSWISPQLTVMLFFRDPHFSQNAKDRLSQRCPVKLFYSELLEENYYQIAHYHQSCRNLASLIGICEQIPSMNTYLAELKQADDVEPMLDYDHAKCGEIAEGWLGNLKTRFAALELELYREEENTTRSLLKADDLVKLEVPHLQESADLYSEIYEEDAELQELTEAALTEWPD